MSGDEIQEEDTFRILLATDCHLGYMERDAVRGPDSITTFEEIMKIALDKNVDFVLLGGDLFHENKPSRKILHQCMCLMRRYCMGDRPVQFEFLSDQSENFKHSGFPIVNYEDPNLNVSLPIFSIHGNHDDPAGASSLCSLDLLSVSGLVNYFGKCVDLDSVQISPLLLQKGKTKLCLFGLGSIRDERLHRLFREGKVSMLRPRENSEEWFNLFVLHQNRAKHGPTNYIPEHFLDNFIDLVVWGHEHECRIIEEWNSQQSFYVTQPGSSVATSLCHGEAVPKHVGLLEITKRKFKITEIPLRTVRQFFIKDIDLDETSLDLSNPDSSEKVIDYCKEIVENFLQKAVAERNGHPKQPDKPLIRLRITYPAQFETFSVQRFGQSFVDRVANPKDIITFTRKKVEKNKISAMDTDALKAVLKQEGLDKGRVEDLVKQYFAMAETDKKLALLSESGMNNAVQEYVDKEEGDAITVLVNHQLKKVQKHLSDKPLSNDNLDDEIEKFKQERMMSSSQEIVEFQNALKECSRLDEKPSASNLDDDDSFFDDDTSMHIATPKRGRGRGRGQGSRGGRGSRGGSRGRGSAKASESVSINGNTSNTTQKRTNSRAKASNHGNKTIEASFQSWSAKTKDNSSWNSVQKGSRKRNLIEESFDSFIDDDDDEDFSISKKRQKTASVTTNRKGVTYDSDTDESF